ncbi:ATP-binding cassette domain-containing protein [Nocardioides litoris]|uniref:branched-chain amino acid ABC transporter ATP-binding protein/permease n=1 Tax=Nocardioides litoris TaxID=1926648 RepID=UPI00111FDAF1|nr:branched-chain amino acid ABC transporter ATP-binding protein/permease [Nocardioides litoris]
MNPQLMTRLRPIGYAGVVALVAALPWLGLDLFWMRQLMLVAMLGLVVSGLNLTFGYAGELALGQAAVYAAGAYAAGYVAKNLVNDVVLVMLVAACVAVLVGVVAGAPGIRLGGWMLAIGSFFLVLLVPDFVNLIGEPLGGYEGLSLIPLPQLLGVELDQYYFYVVVVVVTGAWFALFRNLVMSPRGAEFRVLSAGETLSSSLGVSTYRLKLKAYAIGAVPAGLAGAMFAYLDGYVSSTSFGLHTALLVLAASVLGGMHTIYGALLGAALLTLGPMSSSAFEDYSTVAFGAFLLIGGVFLPRGITPLLRNLLARLQPGRPVSTSTQHGSGRFAPVAGGRLDVSAVVKAFGGNRAVDGVSLVAEPGRITALIGPNGSGKTTLLNVVSGYYLADEGELRINGDEVGQLSASRRARRHIGRTFQTPTIPPDLSVFDTIRTGALKKEVGLLATVLRLPSYHRRQRDAAVETEAIMAALGISDRADDEAAALPLGTRRLVELGRALASEPAVLLLDEVASGLDEDEVTELAGVIGRLRTAGATIVLVEHNFDLITSVSDTVYVLAEGAVLASGGPLDIAQDDKVRQTYLGSGPVDRKRADLVDAYLGTE